MLAHYLKKSLNSLTERLCSLLQLSGVDSIVTQSSLHQDDNHSCSAPPNLICTRTWCKLKSTVWPVFFVDAIFDQKMPQHNFSQIEILQSHTSSCTTI